MSVAHTARRKARTALAVALALASGSAWALGLGQIEVKSKPGEPLLAEIAVVSDDPNELAQLQARLASPDTFARVGLQPPQGLVSDLQFTVAQDASGRPVIRVTSPRPVSEPLLTFLVEVDWGEGRLVREYSALIDAPRTVEAPVQPVAAPVVADPAVVERPVASAPPEPQPEPAPTAQAETPPEPAPVAAAPPQPAAAPAASADEYGPVEPGETLSQIAGRLGDAPANLDQTMVALLRANPDAFIDGNINLLRRGVVLRVPDAGARAAVDAAEATALVRSQIRQWRANRRALAQPEATPAAGDGAGRASATDTSTARVNPGARLEILPPQAQGGARPGTQSGVNAGGEGDMLRQDMQTQETLAAREAELAELKSRISELEQLQQKQQQLIAMKDSELAAAQQKLAQAQAQPAESGSALPWLLGAIALLLGLGGGWWLSRRTPRKATFRAPAAPSPLAQAFAGGPTAEPEAAPDPVLGTPLPAAAGAAPTWHARGGAHGGDAGEDRLDVARAHLDAGDREAARQILSDLLVHGDHATRQQAARLLRELQ
ncbi:MAG TPA: FimV/HubP family polar landmark protein [Lysobacter sp.]|nr:FimV/HubP family polar landmark protein [Lysobacter sp.]